MGNAIDQPLPPAGPERNRELLAARLGWPDGALDACRQLEAAHPGWYVWWADRPWRCDGNVPAGRPCYGAARAEARPGQQSLYAATPGGLDSLIAAAGTGGRW